MQPLPHITVLIELLTREDRLCVETQFTCFTSTNVQILTLLYKQPLPCSPVLYRAAEARGSDACGNSVEAAGMRLFLRDHLPHNETQIKTKNSVEAAGVRLFLRDHLPHNETQVKRKKEWKQRGCAFFYETICLIMKLK